MSESVEEPADLSQEVKSAVSLAAPLVCILAEINVEARILEVALWDSLLRKIDPACGLRKL